MHDVARSASGLEDVRKKKPKEGPFEKRTGEDQRGFSGFNETWNDGLLEHSGLVITCSKEEFDLPSGIGGTMQSSGVAHVPSGLARCKGVLRFSRG